ncbi:MAG: tetratricopeptide repeat protein [Acidobacteriota bacterium]
MLRGHIDAGRFEQSEALLHSYLRANRRDPEAHRELAGIQFKSGKLAAGVQSAKKSVRLDPTNKYGQELLATLLYLTGDKIHALYHWNQVSEPKIKRVIFRKGDFGAEVLWDLFRFNEGEILTRDDWRESSFVAERLRPGAMTRWWLEPAAGNDGWDLNIEARQGNPNSLRLWLVTNILSAALNRELSYHLRNATQRGLSADIGARAASDERSFKFRLSWPELLAKRSVSQVAVMGRAEEWKIGSASFDIETFDVRLEQWSLFRNRQMTILRTSFRNQMVRGQPPRGWAGGSGAIVLGAEWQRWLAGDGCSDSEGAVSISIDQIIRRNGKSAASVRGAGSWERRVDSKRKIDMNLSFQAGTSGGAPVFDSYYRFGVGRDALIPLRAHPERIDGKKGFGPMARGFLAYSADISKRVMGGERTNISAFAFSDGAYLTTELTNSRRGWIRDIGLGISALLYGEVKISVICGYNIEANRWNVWVGMPNRD